MTEENGKTETYSSFLILLTKIIDINCIFISLLGRWHTNTYLYLLFVYFTLTTTQHRVTTVTASASNQQQLYVSLCMPYAVSYYNIQYMMRFILFCCLYTSNVCMYMMMMMMISVFGTIIRYNVLMIINRRGTNYHQNYNRVLKCFADAIVWDWVWDWYWDWYWKEQKLCVWGNTTSTTIYVYVWDDDYHKQRGT